MITVTSKFEMRHLPAAANFKISSISSNVAALLMEKEEKIVSYISDVEILNMMKGQFPKINFNIETFPKRFNKGEKILHITFFKNKKKGEPNPVITKLDYRLIEIEND